MALITVFALVAVVTLLALGRPVRALGAIANTVQPAQWCKAASSHKQRVEQNRRSSDGTRFSFRCCQDHDAFG
jgi:hypothetical protein